LTKKSTRGPQWSEGARPHAVSGRIGAIAGRVAGHERVHRGRPRPGAITALEMSARSDRTSQTPALSVHEPAASDGRGRAPGAADELGVARARGGRSQP